MSKGKFFAILTGLAMIAFGIIAWINIIPEEIFPNFIAQKILGGIYFIIGIFVVIFGEYGHKKRIQ